MHRLIANTQALSLSGIRRGFPASPTGSWIHRDALAEPTGVISEGFDLLAWESPSVSQLAEPLRETLIDQFLSQGVTTVYEIPASAAAVRAYQHLKGAGRLPVRLRLFPTAAPGHQPLAAVETFAHLGIESASGTTGLHSGVQDLRRRLERGCLELRSRPHGPCIPGISDANAAAAH